MYKKITSVKTKLGLGLGLTLLLVAALVGLSLWAIHNLDRATSNIYKQNMVGATAIARTQAEIVDLRSQIQIALNSAPQAVTMRQLPQTVDNARQRMTSAWQRFYPVLVNDGAEREIASKAHKEIESIDQSMSRFIEVVKTQGQIGAAANYGVSLREPLATADQQLDRLNEFEHSAAQQAFADEQALIYQTKILLGGFGLVVFLTTLLMLVWLIRMITRPLNLARSSLESIAAGYLDFDLNHRYSDEFGAMIDTIAAMRTRLAQVVGRVRSHAQSVATGATEIATGNEQLSSRTQEQAASLEQTAASMEQMTVTVRQNADNAAQADQLARNVRHEARDGGEVVAGAVASMHAINEVNRKMAEQLGLIDDIAFQTNLLALNASVEAARAGEQGRGFAVVASEVRNLATRSAAAAKEINTLMADSTKKVAEGSDQVGRSGETLDRINASVEQVSDVVAEIAAASKEQTDGIEQVNQAVTQMDGMTQQNTALVEESTAASWSLEEQARALRSEVAYFKLADTSPIDDSPIRESAPIRTPAITSRADQPAADTTGNIADTDTDTMTPSKSSRKQAPAPSHTSVPDDDNADWATF